MGTSGLSAIPLTHLRKLCCPSVMKVLVTLVVVAVLVLGVADAQGGRRRRPGQNGPGGGPGGRRPGGPGRACFGELCEGTADAETCKSCVKDLHDTTDVPKDDIKACFEAVDGGCRNISADDLSTLRTCVTSASADVGACIAA